MEYNNLNEVFTAINALDEIKEDITTQQYLTMSNYLYEQYNILNEYLKINHMYNNNNNSINNTI